MHLAILELLAPVKNSPFNLDHYEFKPAGNLLFSSIVEVTNL